MVTRFVTQLAIMLFLSVLPARADSLRLIVPAMRPVVGEMILVTIRGEYTGRISLEKMTFPDSTSYDWIQIARDRWADERVDGKMFRIFERRIAVFPRQAGTLTIGPVSHHLTKSDGMTRPVFDIVARPVTLAVTPYPGSGRALASAQVKVIDEFSTDPSRLGPAETFTRRITLTAEGSMAHFLPPRPLIREPWLISFAAPEIRETRLTANGPVAVAIWEWSLRPHTGEVGSLMPVQFPWFNTQVREMRGAVTLPVAIGIAGFGDNIGGAERVTRRYAYTDLFLVGGGLAVALFWALIGQTPAWGALVKRLYRLRRNPKKKGLRRAAAQGDLMALRRAAEDFLNAETNLGRSPDRSVLNHLDQAVFARQPSQDFDCQRFVKKLIASGPAPFWVRIF